MSTIDERVQLATTMLDADDAYIVIAVSNQECSADASGKEHQMYAMLASFITEGGLDIDKLRDGIKWFEDGADMSQLMLKKLEDWLDGN